MDPSILRKLIPAEDFLSVSFFKNHDSISFNFSCKYQNLIFIYEFMTLHCVCTAFSSSVDGHGGYFYSWLLLVGQR